MLSGIASSYPAPTHARDAVREAVRATVTGSAAGRGLGVRSRVSQGGSGYTANFPVAFTGSLLSGGTPATGTALLGVTGITNLSGGTGYGAASFGASFGAATVSVPTDPSGVIPLGTSVTITNKGAYYTAAPAAVTFPGGTTNAVGTPINPYAMK